MKNDQVIAKLQIIKEMATEASVKQLAGVLIEYVENCKKAGFGFDSEAKQ